ncbi:MAG: hypothetical protein ABI852_14985, partial [Gemmatimonadaceae bacterium]
MLRFFLTLVETLGYESITTARIDRRRLTLQRAMRDVWCSLILLFTGLVMTLVIEIGVWFIPPSVPATPAFDAFARAVIIAFPLVLEGFWVHYY